MSKNNFDKYRLRGKVNFHLSDAKMARLFILRHGETEDSSQSGRDIDRNLIARGERDCTVMGQTMRDHMPEPQLVLSSPACRARQTAAIMMDYFPNAKLVEEERIYNAMGETLLSLLHDYGSKIERMMIIGHNPGLIILINALMAEDGNRCMQSISDFPTTSLADIVFEASDFSQPIRDSGTLLSLLRPRDMKKKA